MPLSDNLPVISADRVLRFEPKPRWFIRDPLGIHGLGHEIRVLIWTQVLAAMVREEGLSVDAVTLGWTAAIHDTRRINDGTDADHGIRAARWALASPSVLPSDVSLEQIAYLCEWHVPPDRVAPEMTPNLKVFKDADALDRWRIADLDPAFLRTKSAHRLLRASEHLWAGTHRLYKRSSVFRDVIECAVNMGVLQGS